MSWICFWRRYTTRSDSTPYWEIYIFWSTNCCLSPSKFCTYLASVLLLSSSSLFWSTVFPSYEHSRSFSDYSASKWALVASDSALSYANESSWFFNFKTTLSCPCSFWVSLWTSCSKHLLALRASLSCSLATFLSSCKCSSSYSFFLTYIIMSLTYISNA